MKKSKLFLKYLKEVFIQSWQWINSIFSIIGIVVFLLPTFTDFLEPEVARLIGIGIILISFLRANFVLYLREEETTISSIPQFYLEYADSNGSRLGDSLEMSSKYIQMPEDIPDYSEPKRLPPFLSAYHVGSTNYDYYREKAQYIHATNGTKPFNLWIYNSGNVNANDVRVVFELVDKNHELIVFDEYDFPKRRPSSSKDLLISPILRVPKQYDIYASRTSTGWKIVFSIDKLQPKEHVTSAKLYIGSVCTTDVELTAYIFADDLPCPVEKKLQMKIEVAPSMMNLEQLMETPI